jgi:serine acetyltransferase
MSSLEPRIVKAVHGLSEVTPDPDSELELAETLRGNHDNDELMELYRRHSISDAPEEAAMRRACVRAMARSMGHGVTIKPNVTLIHPETMEIGDNVFLGERAVLQGRFDGTFVIGRGSWLGPHSYSDGRALIIGEYVALGPGAMVLGASHTGLPTDVPFIKTDQEILPVHVEDWADIGANAVLMPGITVGKGCVVGAGAVATRDVPEFSKVAGVPARVIGWRKQPATKGES